MDLTKWMRCYKKIEYITEVILIFIIINGVYLFYMCVIQTTDWLYLMDKRNIFNCILFSMLIVIDHFKQARK